MSCRPWRASKDSCWGLHADPSDGLPGLNPEQREAVLFQGGPLLIVAGPGTGKTHTLTRRIAWMVRERGVPAGRVLAVTFTQVGYDTVIPGQRGISPAQQFLFGSVSKKIVQNTNDCTVWVVD